MVVVQNIKDTIFWKQFTTSVMFHTAKPVLFRISKIQFFESNSQHAGYSIEYNSSCSEYQRYNFLKAIHNLNAASLKFLIVVQNIKDTIFWKQFTTGFCQKADALLLFRISKIQFFESNSQHAGEWLDELIVVQNIKDTIFWKQFTTLKHVVPLTSMLFRISKIQFFESNSQLKIKNYERKSSCSEYQRYNFLKAIHNATGNGTPFTRLFRISKIQFFESNSQLSFVNNFLERCCSEYQRYNFLKAIHNAKRPMPFFADVVQNIKDTIFWKQFTTDFKVVSFQILLFRISKIQFFESNSQLMSKF